MVDQLLLIHANSYSNMKAKMKAYKLYLKIFILHGMFGQIHRYFPSIIQGLNHMMLFLLDSRNPLIDLPQTPSIFTLVSGSQLSSWPGVL